MITCAHVYIYSDRALKQTIYMMLVDYANYILLCVLVYVLLVY